MDRSRRRVWLVIVALGLVFGWSFGADAQVTVVDPGTGRSVQATLGAVVNLAGLPVAGPDSVTTFSLRPQNGMSDADWNNRASLVLQRSGSPSGVPPTVSPQGGAPAQPAAGALTPGAFKNFAGLGEAGLTPSDMGLAVNDAFVVQMVNSRITVMDKSGNTQPGFPKSLQTFFGAGSLVFDPRALYDWANTRWILIAINEDFANSKGFLQLAVSQTSDPRGLYNIYQFQVGPTGQCPDFPTLGQSKAGIIVGFNVFGCSPAGFGGFVNSHVFLISKAQVYAGAATTVWDQFGFNVGGTAFDTLQPANIFDPADRPRAAFVVNSLNINFGGGQCFGGCGGLVVWSISNLFGFQSGGPAPVFAGISLATTFTYFLSFGAHQPGSAFSIDAGDTRISGTVPYKSGSLWASNTTGCIPSCGATNEQSTFIWWQIDPILDDNGGGCTGAFTNLCPKITDARILQQDCYFCGGRGDAGSNYYASFGPDSERDVTVVFNYSDLSVNPGTAFVSRRVTQATNTLHDGGIFLAQQNVFYGQVRWGDYTAAAPDLSGPFGINTGDGGRKVWFSGMFVDGAGNWATQIGANKFVNVSDP